MPQTDLWENYKPGGPHTDTDRKTKNIKIYIKGLHDFVKVNCTGVILTKIECVKFEL